MRGKVQSSSELVIADDVTISSFRRSQSDRDAAHGPGAKQGALEKLGNEAGASKSSGSQGEFLRRHDVIDLGKAVKAADKTTRPRQGAKKAALSSNASPSRFSPFQVFRHALKNRPQHVPW